MADAITNAFQNQRFSFGWLVDNLRIQHTERPIREDQCYFKMRVRSNIRRYYEEIGPVQITLPLGVIKRGPLNQSSMTSL